MRKDEVKKFKLISSSNSITFEEEVKEFLLRHNESNIQFGSLQNEHVAYCTWKEIEKIPEDIRDEYILRGEIYRCEDCPYYGENFRNEPKDAFTCMKRIETQPIRACNKACLWFYERLAKGEIRKYESE